ncbi:MAG: AAA family ATPase, partial [Desulfobulbaceae bacterium]|nr:AAA family ATPase [Desulfobulbaceae bacterium]MCJ7603558.1 AAA family ATPase [Desulfobulbaceae bacterium]
IFSILLQVMDHSTLTDNAGRKADFRNVVLIMTTNAGARELSGQSIGFMTNKKGSGQKAIKNLFSPEFRNRLDAIITFNALELPVMGMIVDKLINELQGRLQEKKVRITLTEKAHKWLATAGHDPDYGARPLRRLIMSEIGDKITEEILFGRLTRGGAVLVDRPAESFVFTFNPDV